MQLHLCSQTTGPAQSSTAATASTARGAHIWFSKAVATVIMQRSGPFVTTVNRAYLKGRPARRCLGAVYGAGSKHAPIAAGGRQGTAKGLDAIYMTSHQLVMSVLQPAAAELPNIPHSMQSILR